LAKLGQSVDRFLSATSRDRNTSDRICRLCDETVCKREDCPAEAFARPKSGDSEVRNHGSRVSSS
jgi:hypothetical protein